jgi:hypothetical protein
MENTTLAILAGLAGSISTVISQKILDLFQDSKKHKYDLQKNYFDRKLAAAEKAAGQFTLLSTSMSNLATLFERIPDSDDENEAQTEMNRQLFANGQAVLQRASDTSYELANSIFIYFDIDDSKFWDTKPIKDFYDKLAETEVINSRVNSLYSYYDTVVDTEHEDYASEQIDQAEEQLRQCFKDISDIFNGTKDIYLKTLKEMRAEMRKFEP